MDFKQVEALVHKTSGQGGYKEEERGSSRSPKGTPIARKRWTLFAPLRLESKSVSNSIGMSVDVLESVRRSEHTCANFVWNHTARWSVRTTLGGGHPKIRVRGSTRVRGECCACPTQGVKRSRDTILESASPEKSISVGGRSPRGSPRRYRQGRGVPSQGGAESGER